MIVLFLTIFYNNVLMPKKEKPEISTRMAIGAKEGRWKL
jgi:hypothetical protein